VSRDLEREIIALLARRADLDAAHLGPDVRLDTLAIDSVDLAYVLATLEREHGIAFDDADVSVSAYETVASLVDVIDGKLAATR
jgi:acyl carrier protein